MKKILLFLASFSLISTTALSVVSCSWKIERNDGNNENITEPTVKYNILSVGNGQFTYLQVGNKAIVLDVGRGRPGKVYIEPLKLWRRTEIGWEFIQNHFEKNGVEEVEAVIISHAHEDHTWLLRKMVEAIKVNTIVMPATNFIDTTNHLVENGFKGTILTEFQAEYNFLGIKFENLSYYINHDDLVNAGIANPNDSSIVLRFDIFDQTILFTGDADRKQVALNDEILIKKIAEKQVDIYIIPHHGSANSGNERFLDVIGQNLKYAFISGTLANEEWKDFGGGFHFPYPQTINFLKQKASQAEVYVTGALPQAPLKDDPDFYSQVKGSNQSYVFEFNRTDFLNQKYTTKLLFESERIIDFVEKSPVITRKS